MTSIWQDNGDFAAHAGHKTHAESIGVTICQEVAAAFEAEFSYWRLNSLRNRAIGLIRSVRTQEERDALKRAFAWLLDFSQAEMLLKLDIPSLEELRALITRQLKKRQFESAEVETLRNRLASHRE